jgi:hypothetical protein
MKKKYYVCQKCRRDKNPKKMVRAADAYVEYHPDGRISCYHQRCRPKDPHYLPGKNHPGPSPL